jgi:NADH:ubiquinone reductase (H+-translocating)
VSIRAFLRHTTFRMAEVLDVDFSAAARSSTGWPASVPTPRISYDHLVLALGSATRLPDIPGLKRHGLEMKTPSDAVALRDRAIQMLEAADANPNAGRRGEALASLRGGRWQFHRGRGSRRVPCFPQVGRAAVPQSSAPEECNVTLVELTDRILSALDPDSVRTMLSSSCVPEGIYVLLNSFGHAHRGKTSASQGRAKFCRPATVIWCAGIQPSRLLQKLDLPLGPAGLHCLREGPERERPR